MLVASLYLAIGFMRENLIHYDRPGNALDPFTDAITYLAAGERLNAGHELYRLSPGDRPVLVMPELFAAPLVSPPPIAVIWRPIALVPGGFQAWVLACWLTLLGTVCYLIIKTGFAGLLLALLLGPAIGEQMAVANVAAVFPALLVLAWRYRERAWIGIAIGAMAGIKLAPIAMTGWLIAERRWKAIAIVGITMAVLVIVGAIGAGVDSYFDYLSVAATVRPSTMSISGLSGTTWMSYLVLGGGWMVAAALWRWPRASYCVAVVASVLGTPALYASSLVPLLALAAPLVPERGHTTRADPASALVAPESSRR